MKDFQKQESGNVVCLYKQHFSDDLHHWAHVELMPNKTDGILHIMYIFNSSSFIAAICTF